MECVRRDVGHLCAKDERQPRAKRAKTHHSHNQVKNNGLLNDTCTASSTAQTRRSEAEEAVQALERFVDSTPSANGHPSTMFDPIVSFVAPDYPNPYWSSRNSVEGQNEKRKLIRDIVDALPETDLLRLLHEVFVTRCQGPLCNVFHTPTFLKQAEELCGCLSLISIEAKIMAISNAFSMDTLACHLLAVCMPCPAPSLCSQSLL